MLADTLKNFVEESLGLLLGVGLEEILIQLGGTIVLFLVIRKYFWKNLTEFMEKRRAYMDEELFKAEALKVEAAQIKANADETYSTLRNSVSKTLEDARVRAQKEESEIIAKAKAEAQRLKLEAEKEVELEVQKAQDQMKKEIVTVATVLAEKIIQKEVDAKKYEQWVDEATNEVKRS
ncbi:F0F1 ATP synthase subunit B [Paracholeplasma manati]|uniref:F0F1 ATP synthase subunit B n=1 Tax=Paracholeplasma manati TaxID=591373 RepID=UPI0024085745|nr:F0F1 ATP synthase subunit B [Paracholeplasma manati]MDG0889524.1 F0F1 ATP synthase subunit B [Paracholeplasma manati]